MSLNADLQLHYRLVNAPVQLFPYPHIYVEDVFPADFYREIRKHLLPKESHKTLTSLKRVSDGYPDTRVVLPLTPDEVGQLEPPFRDFWQRMALMLLDGVFTQLVLSKFGPYLQQRFPDPEAVQFRHEALLVQDYSTYSLGPHTDSTAKVMSFLFYLPEDDSHSHLGTSLYIPKEPGFTCPGGPHYDFDEFHRMITMPYKPNTLFAFLKTETSFHGVEPIKEPVRRDLLLYDIKADRAASQQPAYVPSAPPKAGSKFSF
jgi:hypothetical protein